MIKNRTRGACKQLGVASHMRHARRPMQECGEGRGIKCESTELCTGLKQARGIKKIRVGPIMELEHGKPEEGKIDQRRNLLSISILMNARLIGSKPTKGHSCVGR